ncbi:class I SAM-dependent methyltransferase [Ectopseudomonas mendocina]|uniref:Class I SAM-dependent methyltransferase n=1 Tax=Ectopseudomonas mendocina TaxID=300 RepID=A0ABZ2RFK2_ECTME
MLKRLMQYPAVRALFAQCLACVFVGVLVYLAAQLSSWRPPIMAAGLLQGLVAAILGRYLGLSRWWLAINLLFVPALLLSRGAELPSWLFLAGFALLLLLNWNSVVERVPLYLSGASTRQALIRLLQQQPAGFRFIDLGCGPGGALLALAKAFPHAQFVGVETAPLSFALAWLRACRQPNCQIRFQNLWRTDLSSFDVVYCFLSPAPMAPIWNKAQEQMRTGSLLISNSFEVAGQPAGQVIEVGDLRGSRLLIWQMQR